MHRGFGQQVFLKLAVLMLLAVTLAVSSLRWGNIHAIVPAAMYQISLQPLTRCNARPQFCKRSRCVAFRASNTDAESAAGGSEKKRGYQFGDLFLNKITGKDKYEFGDLSRWMDGKVKEAACQLTGKETYEFGDISKFFDAKAKQEVSNLTGKDTYEFGDISKEIARRVQAGEVNYEDMSLLLRAVLTLGLGLTPVAHLLPVQFLLGMYTESLKYEAGTRVAGKVSGAVATELDRRAKGTILGEGNEDYVLGDLTKAQLQKHVANITGKDTYEFGDISKAFLAPRHTW